MRHTVGRLVSDYGIVLVLLVLCAVFSVATLEEQAAEGRAGGEELARQIAQKHPGAKVAIVAGTSQSDGQFAKALRSELEKSGHTVLAVSQDRPSVARSGLTQLVKEGRAPDIIATSRSASRWLLFDQLNAKVPGVGSPVLLSPAGYQWPVFLNGQNLLNVANQIAVIAILAAGMTLVIITGGIDLSVGSLIALSAVIAAYLVKEHAGAKDATPNAMVGAGLAAIAVCGLVGALSGLIVTQFAVPPFIVTLGMMLMASGAAFILSNGGSIADVPDSFVWLGRGAVLFGIPNPVVLMLGLYSTIHIVLTRTAFGRYVYAVGGNAEASRLAGVRVSAIIVAVYVLNGLLAGVGGVITASNLKSGSPTYGALHELYVIAAVVVGGTSLTGGAGNVIGTLIGVLIIAVIRNGMNLTGVEAYTQNVVLGAIIIGAVLADRLRRWGRK